MSWLWGERVFHWAAYTWHWHIDIVLYGGNMRPCLHALAAGKYQLEQLERLRSEDTPRRLMITHTIDSCWIPSQNKVEWPWRYRSRSKVITCDTPSYASNHLYQIWKESIQNDRRYRADMIFKVKANDLENIGQGQRSLHATHPLMLMMICAKYGKNISRIVDFFSRWKP